MVVNKKLIIICSRYVIYGINTLSYALQTVYHDIDTTTLVLDVLVLKKKN